MAKAEIEDSKFRHVMTFIMGVSRFLPKDCYPGKDLNQGPSEYEAGVLTTRQQRPVTACSFYT
jgi:hypothetical protein